MIDRADAIDAVLGVLDTILPGRTARADSTLRGDLAMREDEIVWLAMNLEDYFQIVVSQQEKDSWDTVDDTADFIARTASEQPA